MGTLDKSSSLLSSSFLIYKTGLVNDCPACQDKSWGDPIKTYMGKRFAASKSSGDAGGGQDKLTLSCLLTLVLSSSMVGLILLLLLPPLLLSAHLVLKLKKKKSEGLN